MGVIASAYGDKEFENPPQGVHQAVCVDVVDMGMVENKQYNKTQHKIRIVFQLEAKMADGRPFIASRRFTNSLAEQSALRPFLEMWRGKAFSSEELKGFDTDLLIGANAMVQILYSTEGDQTYANISAAFPLPSNTKKMVAEGYTRVKDRDGQQAKATAAPASPPRQSPAQPPPASRPIPRVADDDDVPFVWIGALFAASAALMHLLGSNVLC